MLNIPTRLAEREEPVRAGVIGAGLFGTNLVRQLEATNGLEATAIADIETEKALGALEQAGVSTEETEVVADADAGDDAIASGRRAVFADGEELTESDVEVVVEATGIPDVGARHAYAAIMGGKHVVMATVEAETVVGPILARLAERNGVTYSMAYGDQPALIVELCDWARTVGLEVVAAGKGNAYLETRRHGTPDDIFDRLGVSDAFVEEHGLNPRMYNSFYDGTKVAVEMCSVANAVGFPPDVPRMHLPTAEISEIPKLLRPEADGGILENTGVVETVSTLYPDGSAVEEDIGFGVFIVTTTPSEPVRSYLDQHDGSGLHTASDGAYQVFYRPYHLPGIETGISVANAALRNEPTGAPRGRTAEVVGAAKRDLDPGVELDGGGGYTVYGVLVDAERVDEEGYVPFELLEGGTVTREIERDEILTAADVEIDDSSFIYKLRQLQDETF